MVHLSRSRIRPEGSDAVRTGTLLPVPSLLRSRLREQEGERDVPGSPQGACYPREARGSANMMEPFPEKSKSVRRKTYERLWWEHHEAEMEQLAVMREWLGNSIRR